MRFAIIVASLLFVLFYNPAAFLPAILGLALFTVFLLAIALAD